MKSLPSKMIMLIDDNEIDNFINKKFIEESKITCNIQIMTTAVAALKYLHSQSDQEKIPSLILLDLNLPAINGYDFLDKFEELDPQIKINTRIAILSSSDRFHDIVTMKNNPLVSDYFVKPLNNHSVDMIRALLETA